jgi:hypothetical protein
MKIGVSGSRRLNYEQRKEARRILTELLSEYGEGDELHHGCANGIDTIAAQVAAFQGMTIVQHPAMCPDWESGYKPRNKRLVNAVDKLFALHSSDSQTGGTIWTYQYAMRKGVDTKWIEL